MRNIFLSLRFARRELRAGLSGFYIFIICLVFGVAAIAGVRSVSAGLTEALFYNGRYILGADIALRTIYQPATTEQFSFLQKMGPITVVAETRAMARRLDDTQATMVELKAVDPFYPLYGEINFVDEDKNPITTPTQDLLVRPIKRDEKEYSAGDWGALVERELLPRLGLHIGDFIYVGKQRFQIRGIINREPDRVSARGYSIAPRVMISSYIINETGLSQQGSQIYYDYRLMLPAINNYHDVEHLQKKITDKFPEAKWRGRNFYNASPRIKRTIEQLTLFLTLIGLTTLLIGGVGISSAVRGFLDAKLANIATLKCLGASAKFARRVYFIQIIYIATFAVLLGTLVGMWGARAATTFLTNKFALEDVSTFYPVDLGIAAIFGFLTVICFSLWPLGRAAAISPRELFRDLVSSSHKRPDLNTILTIVIAAQTLALGAIFTATDQFLAIWFAGSALAAFGLFALYTFIIKAICRRLHIRGWPEMRMALANLYRPGNVSLNVVLSLGLGLTVLCTIALVEFNMSRLLRDDLAVDAPSFFFLDVQPHQKDGFAALLEKTPDVRNVIFAPSFRGRITKVNGVDAEEALVDKSEDWVIRSDRGFTYAAKQPAYSKITQGAWWAEDFNTRNANVPPTISISTDVAKAFDIGVDDKLTLNVMGVDITATVANVREIDWASFTMNFAVTFAPGALDGAPATIIATAIVPEDQEIELQNTLAKEFPNITSVRVREALAAAANMLAGVLQSVRIAAGVTLVSGILVLSGGIAAARRRHFYDAVVLKVLGATRWRILKTFLLEYLLLGAMAVLIAAALGTAAAYGIIVGVMDLGWKFSGFALGSVALLSFIITLSAGFLGTLGALTRKPAQYLRNQ